MVMQSDWCVFKSVVRDKKIYLFGAGDLCKKFLKAYPNLKIQGIFDNYKTGMFHNIKLLSIDQLSIMDKDYSVIAIASIACFSQIKSQLEAQNVKYIFNVRDLLPYATRCPTTYFYGQYDSWQQALSACEKDKGLGGGYKAGEIFDKVTSAIQCIRRGEACFERDGMLFYRDDYNYPLLAALFYVLSCESFLDVIDVGGSLGSTYFQNRSLFAGRNVKWSVVEQPHFVSYGRENVPEIDFYTLDDLYRTTANLFLLSGVLQYFESPYEYLKKIVSTGKQYILLDRVNICVNEIQNEMSRLVMQKVQPPIYSALYPVWLLSLDEIKKIVLSEYSIILEWKSDETVSLLDEHGLWKDIPFYGMLLKKM